MLNDTITTIENQFFDGLKAVQEPTIGAARKAAELVGRAPFIEPMVALTSKLPSVEAVVSRNFAFAQRLLDAQRDFALGLAGIPPEAPTPRAKTAKKSAS